MIKGLLRAPLMRSSFLFLLNLNPQEYKDAEGSVITVDFYNASALLPLTDEALIERVQMHLETCEPGFKGECSVFGQQRLQLGQAS